MLPLKRLLDQEEPREPALPPLTAESRGPLSLGVWGESRGQTRMERLLALGPNRSCLMGRGTSGRSIRRLGAPEGLQYDRSPVAGEFIYASTDCSGTPIGVQVFSGVGVPGLTPNPREVFGVLSGVLQDGGWQYQDMLGAITRP